MPAVEVLIPTCDRPAALAVTLTSLAFQDADPFSVTVADQGDAPATKAGEVVAALRVLRLHGHRARIRRNLPRRGMAQQRQFLLEQATAPGVLYLDDDLILEPDTLRRLQAALARTNCGFVGIPLIGLSYLGEERPHEQHIEFWDGPVQPEDVRPGTPAWERYRLHSAANVYHVQQKLGLSAGDERLYRVAWVGGCVLYDRLKLRACGGFAFWQQLPAVHCGEDVQAQLEVMRRYGGCGLLPSGVYHQELVTTLPDRSVVAPQVLGATPGTAPLRRLGATAAGKRVSK